jgi:hypothetical protein
MLPPEEIAAAITRAAARHIGVEANDVVVAASRLLGFRATGQQLRRVIVRELDMLLSDGRLKRQGEKLFVAPSE